MSLGRPPVAFQATTLSGDVSHICLDGILVEDAKGRKFAADDAARVAIQSVCNILIETLRIHCWIDHSRVEVWNAVDA